MKRILIDNKQEDLKQIAYSIPWKSDTVCLQQICICNSHVESVQPIANLIKKKKKNMLIAKSLRKNWNVILKGFILKQIDAV